VEHKLLQNGMLICKSDRTRLKSSSEFYSYFVCGYLLKAIAQWWLLHLFHVAQVKLWLWKTC